MRRTNKLKELFKSKSPWETKKKKQQYVYVVHQFATSFKKSNPRNLIDIDDDVLIDDHKILGVYKNREDAEERRSRCTKHADIYTGEMHPYIAVTRHKVKGEPE